MEKKVWRPLNTWGIYTLAQQLVLQLYIHLLA